MMAGLLLGARRPPKGICRTSSEQAVQRAVYQHLRQTEAAKPAYACGGRQRPKQ